MRKIAKIFQAVDYWPTLFLLKFLVHYQIRGRENLEGLEGKPIIFASNHSSYLDPPLGGISLPRKFLPVIFVATETLYKFNRFRNLFFAPYAWLHGSIMIGKRGGNLQTSLKEVVLVLKRGERVWMFPEGKIIKGGNLGQGKRGVVYLHRETRAPIVPVAIIGTSGILSPTALLKAFFGLKKIEIVFGRPIYSLAEGSLEQGVEKVMSAIEELMTQQVR